MKIISHRGFWRKKSEKNSFIAFRRAFENGFGVETDLRDQNGRIVISHDMPKGKCLGLEEFFRLYRSFRGRPVLALNIKADGLQSKLKDALLRHRIANYFVFDMSIPDALGYRKTRLTMFSRQSEVEPEPLLYNSSQGVWLDEFFGHWIDSSVIRRHARKKICIVSPELHGRDHRRAWNQYRKIQRSLKYNRLMICTDYPDKAQEFFNEQN